MSPGLLQLKLIGEGPPFVLFFGGLSVCVCSVLFLVLFLFCVLSSVQALAKHDKKLVQ